MIVIPIIIITPAIVGRSVIRSGVASSVIPGAAAVIGGAALIRTVARAIVIPAVVRSVFSRNPFTGGQGCQPAGSENNTKESVRGDIHGGVDG
jgi:hypothetical protein